MTQFLLSPSIQALGWTLLHSLWQGLACLMVVLIVFRCLPTNWSGIRYAVATTALLCMFILSLFSFTYLNDSLRESTVETTSIIHYSYPVQNFQPGNNYISGVLNAFTATLRYYLPFIVICWCFGMVLFTMRLFGGWLTVQRLRASAIPVEEQWNNRLRTLARKLNIHQFVILAESAMTEAPVVIGYFKPMILIPLGMLGGLSTDQLESIIAHELIHIRRRDYLVNLLQSVLEILYFFNPFAWAISGIIRREREHCCDDAVVALHGNPLAYALALTALEEARLSKAGIALSLAEDKNQLLNRIKRIMEKSVKPYSLRDRIVPAILLVTGLLCASWLTVNSNKAEGEQNVKASAVAVPDTTIKIEKSRKYYRKSVTTIGKDGKPHEEVVEEYSGDDELRPLAISAMFDFPLPPLPAAADIYAPFEAMTVVPPIEFLSALPALPDFKFDLDLNIDTIPSRGFHPRDARHWEEWAKQFENKFIEQFGCQKRVEEQAEQIQQMMQDFETRFDHNSMEQLADKMQRLSLHDQLLQNEEIWAQHERQMENFGKQMEQWTGEHARHLEQLDKHLQDLKIAQGVFEKEFRDELVKDGYLNQDEDISSIEIDDENIKVNNKKIKESDLKKYRSLLQENEDRPRK